MKSTAANKRQRLTREERRDQIIEAARGVFLSVGPRARTRDIAEAAGVNEALLYQHFRSKEEIFEEAVVYPVERVVTQLAADVAALPDHLGYEMHREITESFIRELLVATRDSVSLLTTVLFSEPEAGRAFYRNRIWPLIDTVAAIVTRNLPAWEHRDFDVETTVRAVLWMSLGVSIDSELTGREFDPEVVARQLTELIFRGLLAGDVGGGEIGE
ncbi:MAG: hypothetical protein JJLCMIEE_00938 [Acidimicrobiales bacterium]|nr:hypothetical protein [Acidimicrobiales bacterium]